MFDILKNPIIIGLLVALITYVYMYWEANKKYEKNPKIKREQISILIPSIVGIIAWFIASGYFNNNNNNNNNNIIRLGGNTIKNNVANIVPQYVLNNNNNDMNESCSFYLLQKDRIKIPKMDVLIDLGRFN